jgi:hypothetical protein
MSGCKTLDIVPYLSEVTEMQNELDYRYTGKIGDYSVSVYENGVSLKGSLSKNLFGDNLHTLTRRSTKQAIEDLSDRLHADINAAKVTRLDVSTVIPAKRPPSDYYAYLGQKPYFERLQSTPDTLYYNSHQRQIVFYDKAGEASAKGVQIPVIWQNSYLLRYELRYIKYLNRQLKVDLTAAKLYETEFYRSVIWGWYNEFKTIHKLKKQSFMIDNVNSRKEAKEALFAYLLQEAGQGIIDEFLSDLKAQRKFSSRSDYTKLKDDLNKIIVAKNGNKSELIQELETAIFDIARYAR